MALVMVSTHRDILRDNLIMTKNCIKLLFFLDKTVVDNIKNTGTGLLPCLRPFMFPDERYRFIFFKYASNSTIAGQLPIFHVARIYLPINNLNSSLTISYAPSGLHLTPIAQPPGPLSFGPLSMVALPPLVHSPVIPRWLSSFSQWSSSSQAQETSTQPMSLLPSY